MNAASVGLIFLLEKNTKKQPCQHYAFPEIMTLLNEQILRLFSNIFFFTFTFHWFNFPHVFLKSWGEMWLGHDSINTELSETVFPLESSSFVRLVCRVHRRQTRSSFSLESSSAGKRTARLFSSQFISLHINLLLQSCVTCQCSALIENCAEASQNPIRSGLKSILSKRSHSNKGLHILC